MARIFITQRLSPGAVEPLTAAGHVIEYRDSATPASKDELREGIASADALICMLGDHIDAELLTSSACLKVVATVSVGFDNIDLDVAKRRHIAVCNTPGVLDDATAEIALFLLLATRRRTTPAETMLRDGRWQGWNLTRDLGLGLTGATLGLVGYGRIAQAVARRADSFGLRVLHTTRRPTGVPGWTASLNELAEKSDILSIHAPHTEATTRLVDAQVLAKLRPSSVVINTSRGPLLDEDALCDALEAGKLWGAGLDVFVGEPQLNPRLLDAPNVVLLPHIGSATIETRRAMSDLAVRAVLDVLSGKTPKNLVQN